MKTLFVVALTGIAIAAGAASASAAPHGNSIMVHGYTTSYGR